MAWRRNRQGTIFHRADCERRGDSQPWPWAGNRSLAEVLLTLESAAFSTGIPRPCRYCCPDIPSRTAR